MTLQEAIDTWLSDNKAQNFSPRTIQSRRYYTDRFVWWLGHECGIDAAQTDISQIDSRLIRQFLAYVRDPHPQGRFGCGRAHAKRESKPSSVHRFFHELRTLFNFSLAEGFVDESPLRNVKPRSPNAPSGRGKMRI